MIKLLKSIGNKNTVFILQVTDSAFKAIKCSKDAKKEFLGLESETFPEGIDNQKLIEKLSSALHKLGINNNPVVLSLSRNQATCRHITIPAQSPQEIAKIATLQAPRYLPYPINELITGYQVIKAQPGGYSAVNLVIVHKDVISRYLEIFKALKVKQFSIHLGSYGICNLYNYLFAQEALPVMIIDVDFNQVELVVIAERKMVFSRYFKLNRSREDWKFTFVEEVNRSRETYAKEFLREFSQKILILGSGKIVQDCYNLLKEKIPLTIEQVDFYKKINLSEPLIQKIQSSGCSFTSLFGFGLEAPEETLNLLPLEAREKGAQLNVYRKGLKAFFFVAFISLVWIIAIVKNLDNKSKYLQRLKNELDKISKEARPLEEIEKRSKILQGQSAKRASSLDLLTACFKSLPNLAYLTSFSYEEGNQVILRGQAQELNPVFVFVSALEKAPELKNFNIKVRYASKRKTKTGEMVDFEIACLNK
ncbi:MAG: pilus assembly protein PilM [Candidatus Omnitrophica bacterium]|nr:pilus assembly protein PilM [Candidatus Omnitrophota bacterium]